MNKPTSTEIGIHNDSTGKVTWLAYNHLDPEKCVPLSTGELEKGASHNYQPPANIDGRYTIVFESRESVLFFVTRWERGAASAPLAYTVTLSEREGLFETRAAK